MRNKLNFVRQSLYALKKDYGESIDLYKRKTVSDFQTGRRITTRLKVHIKKAIILPSISVIKQLAHNEASFDYGGLTEVSDRVIIIDSRDIPNTFKIEEDDYLITTRHKKYEIKKITDYEFDAGYILNAKETDAVGLAEIFDRPIKDKIAFHSLASIVP